MAKISTEAILAADVIITGTLLKLLPTTTHSSIDTRTMSFSLCVAMDFESSFSLADWHVCGEVCCQWLPL
jgi:phosphate/sulfate permease